MLEFTYSPRAVPWTSLQHAYGSAEGVPTLLAALLSEDPDERGDAYFDGLIAALWHEGTIYQATPHVVSFLVDMIGSPLTPCRGRLANALALMAMSGRRAVDGDTHAGKPEHGVAVLLGLRATMSRLLAAGAASPALRPMLVLALSQDGDSQRLAAELTRAGLHEELELLHSAAASIEHAWLIFDELAPALEADPDEL